MEVRIWARLGSLALVVALLAALGLGLAWRLWGQHVWPGEMMGLGRLAPSFSGRMRDQAWYALDQAGQTAAPAMTWAQIAQVVDTYLAAQGFADLQLAEFLEFEYGFYALVAEADTGIGAMELIINKATGAVGPEHGPNLMWNARYAMHAKGMMGLASGGGDLPPEAAWEAAQRWLDEYRPGAQADQRLFPLYGYYTIRVLRDEGIEGLLSVRASTGQVWYRTWLGKFVRALELRDGE